MTKNEENFSVSLLQGNPGSSGFKGEGGDPGPQVGPPVLPALGNTELEAPWNVDILNCNA